MVSPVAFSSRTKKVLGWAADESRRTRAREIEPEHLLLGILLEGQSLACQALRSRHITASDIMDAVRDIRISHSYGAHNGPRSA